MVQQRLWLVLLGLVLLSSELAESHKFKVGGNQGWTFGVVNWPNGKVFHAKDVLVFKYGARIHDVVRVDKHGYDKCLLNKNSLRYNSGDDHIKLNKGTNYFICSVPGHCQTGMKIAVKAI